MSDVPIVVGVAVRHVRIGHRQIFQHRGGHGIDAAGGNDVTRERLPCQRVVDDDRHTGGVRRPREIAGALERRRHHLGRVPRLRIGIVLAGDPEKRPVLDDRSAEAEAAEVVRVVGLRQVRFVAEEVVLRERNRAGLVEGGAPETVRPRLQGGVEDAAARGAHLRVVGVDLNLHVLERFDRRVGDGAIAHVGDRDPIDRVAVAAPRAAAKRQQRRVGLILLPVELRVTRGNDRGYGGSNHERRAARGRQRLQRG